MRASTALSCLLNTLSILCVCLPPWNEAAYPSLVPRLAFFPIVLFVRTADSKSRNARDFRKSLFEQLQPFAN